MAYTTIDKPSDHFNTKLYTGTGSSLAISGVGFQPDWIWFKERGATRSHALVDSVRGRNKVVFADLTNAEETSAASTNDLKSFDSDGFTVGVTNVSGSFNTDSGSHVAWNWKAGTAFSNDASSTGIGTLDSSGSVNATAGFSIISFTGTESSDQSVAHGLGAVPELILSKSRDVVDNWMVHHGSFDENQYISLNLVSAVASSGNVWRSLPTSTLINIGDNAGVNDDGAMIMYAFRSVQGYSKFGSYTGNGNAAGSFIYTGFKPAMVIFKQTSGGNHWYMFDNKRNPVNPKNNMIKADNSAAESTDLQVDFLSNGIKYVTSDHNNSNGQTYIYMAFAEEPFVTSTGVPATAI